MLNAAVVGAGPVNRISGNLWARVIFAPAANRPSASQNDAMLTKRATSMKSIRTRVAIRIIKLAAALCGLALVIAPWPLADGQP
jgi:hypothetical protein